MEQFRQSLSNLEKNISVTLKKTDLLIEESQQLVYDLQDKSSELDGVFELISRLTQDKIEEKTQHFYAKARKGLSWLKAGLSLIKSLQEEK